MRSSGAKAAAMEVSSHGLVQGRVNGVRFACALFTNLSHDHLDYHGSMQAYGAAKARLFETPGLECAVLNLDDRLGVELAARLAGRVRTIGYSLEPRDAAVDQAIVADARVRSPAPGSFNLSNALGVIGCLLAKGIAFDERRPGRFAAARCRAHAGRSAKSRWWSSTTRTPGCARQRPALAAPGGGARAAAPERGIRRRRRPRSEQARADGRDRCEARRPRADHFRQSAQ
jgi:hypothetical protein